MLLTRSSGYTVLSCYRSRDQHEEPILKRDGERETPCGLCSPFQTQLALHVIVSWFNHVQLLFVCLSTWQWSRSQDPLQETSSFSASYHTLLACSALSLVVYMFTLPEMFLHLAFSALLLTISTPVNILLHYCDKCQYIQARGHALIVWLHTTF